MVFLYPIALSPILSQPESPRLQWALFGFSPLAALALLLLVPAARGGAAYVAKNGSPWRWPLYPWSLFFVIAMGVCVRCYSLCVSFHFVNGSQTIFGPYFLVPIGFAVSLIWLEIGVAARRPGVMFAASATPLVLAFVAATDHRYEPSLHAVPCIVPANPRRHAVLPDDRRLGGISGLCRRATRPAGMGAPVAARSLLWRLSVLARSISDELVPLRPLPLAAAGLVLGSAALRRRHSFRALLAGLLLAAAGTRVCASVWPSVDWGLIALAASDRGLDGRRRIV